MIENCVRVSVWIISVNQDELSVCLIETRHISAVGQKYKKQLLHVLLFPVYMFSS